MIQLIPEQIIQENMYHLLHNSKKMKETGAIENQDTFAVIGASVAENFGVQMPEGTDWKINIEGAAVGK